MTIFLSGCARDEFSRNKLCESLRTSYTASADFITSNHSKNVIGKMDIVRGEKTTVTFSSPKEYSSISVTGDSLSNPDILSFEYSGIPAQIPKSISGELSLIFLLFSDEIPIEIEKLEKDCFTKNDDGTGEVFFLKENMSCKIKYSLDTGIPYCFEAGNDELSISLVLSDFKHKESD